MCEIVCVASFKGIDGNGGRHLDQYLHLVTRYKIKSPRKQMHLTVGTQMEQVNVHIVVNACPKAGDPLCKQMQRILTSESQTVHNDLNCF